MTNTQVQLLLEYIAIEDNNELYSPQGIDGVIGPKTRSALSHIKKDYGVDEKGLIGIIAKTVPHAAPTFDELVEETLQDDWWNSIRHFKRKEFACKCGKCGGFPVEPVRELVEVADELREHFNAEVRVSSGVRCEAHNKAVGGVAGSRHKLGKAMDFCVQGVSGSIVKVYCDKLIKAGKLRYCYIIDGNYVHMDVV